MAKWKDITDQELDARTIWTASYGWQQCDPLGRVFGRTARECKLQLVAMVRDEAERFCNDEAGERFTRREAMDDIWAVGPFSGTVEELIADMEDHSRADELRDDIRRSARGWVY